MKNVSTHKKTLLLFVTLLVAALHASGQTIIDGTVFQSDRTTNVGPGTDVRIRWLDASGPALVDAGTVTTGGSGDYSLDIGATAANDVVLVYIDGGANQGAAAFVADGNNQTINLYQLHLVVRDETFTSISNGDLGAVDETAIGDVDVPFEVSGGNDLTVDTGIHLWINDNVTYQPAGTITTQAAGGSLSIRDGARLDSNGNAVTVGGSWDNSGTGTYTSGANTTTFTGAGATYTINTGGVGNGNDFYDVVLDDGGGVGTFQLTGDLDVNNDLTITDGVFDTNGLAVSVGGDWSTAAAGSFSAAGTTVTFDAEGAGGPYSVTTNGSSFGSVTLDDAGSTYQQGDDASIGAALTITDGTWDTQANALTVTGGVTNADTITGGAAGLLDFQSSYSGAGTVNIGAGGVLVQGNAVFTGGTIDFIGVAGRVLEVRGDLTFDGATVLSNITDVGDEIQLTGGGATFTTAALALPSVTVNTAGTLTLGGNVDVNGTLTVSGGTLDMNDGTQRTATVEGDVDFTGGALVDPGQLTFDGSGPQQLTPLAQTFAAVVVADTSNRTVSFTGTSTVDDLTVGAGETLLMDGSGGNVTINVTNGSAVTNNGVFQLDDSGGALQLDSAGTFTFSGNGIDFNASVLELGGVDYNGPAITLGANEGITLVGDVDLNNTLTLNDGTAAVNTQGNALSTTDDTVTVNAGTLTIGAGGSVDTGAGNLTNSGTIDSSGSITTTNFISTGTFTNSAANTIAAAGDVTISGTFDGTTTDNTLTMSGAFGTTLDETLTTGSLGNVDITGEIELSTDVELDGDFTIAVGAELYPGILGRDITVGGSWENSGLMADNPDLIMDPAAGTVSLDAGGTAGQQDFREVTIAGAAGTIVRLDSDLAVDQTMTIAANGELDGNGRTLEIGGSWTSNGTFTANNSTVDLQTASTATISGNTTFSTLRSTEAGKTLEFAAGSTQTAANVELTGADGNLIRLISDTGGNAWELSYTGTSDTVSFAFIQDSELLTTSITPSNSTNGGGNDPGGAPEWDFAAAPVRWDGGGGDSDWANGDNWNTGTVPTGFDAVEIPAGPPPNLPATLTANQQVETLDIQAAGNAVNIDGFTLDINNAGGVPNPLLNAGTILRHGGDQLNVAGAIPGTVRYETAGAIQDYGAADYENLEIQHGVAGSSTLGADLAVSGTLDVAVGELDTQGNALTVTGGVTNADTITGGAAGLLDFQSSYSGAGTVNIGAGGVLVQGNAVFTGGTIDFIGVAGRVLEVRGDLTFDGATVLSNITDVGDEIQLTGGGATFTTAALALPSVTVNTAGTLTLGGNVDVNGTLTVSGGTLDMNDGTQRTATVEGDVDFTGGALVDPGQLTFDGSGPQQLTPLAQTFAAVVVADTSNRTVSFTGTSTVDDLTVGAGETLLMDGSGGNVTINVTNGSAVTNNGVFQLDDSGGALQLDSAGTFTFSGNGIDFNASVLELGGVDYNGPAITLGANEGITLVGDVDLNNTLTLNDGTAAVNTQGNALSTTDDTVTVNAGTLTIGAGGSVDTGAGNLTNSGTIDSSGSITTTNFISTGTFTNSAANTIAAAGGVVIQGIFSAPTTNNTLTMSGGGPATLNAAVPIGNLNIAATGQVRTLTNDLDADGTVTINGTLDAATNGQNVTVGGDWTNAGVFEAGPLVTFDGTGVSITTGGGGGDQDFEDVTFDGGGVFDLVVGNDLDANGTLRINAGTLDANGQDISVGESWIAGGTGAYVSGSGFVAFDGEGGGGPYTVDTNGSSFAFVLINDAGNEYRQISDVTIGDNFTVFDGTWNTQANQLTVVGDVFNNNPGEIRTGGAAVDFQGAYNGDGTLSLGAGGVTIQGNADATDGTIDFGAGVDRTLEVQGNLTLNNASALSNAGDGGDLLRFNAAVAQQYTTGNHAVQNITKQGGSRLDVFASLNVGDVLRIAAATDEVAVGGNDFTIGDLDNSGVFELDGTQTTHTISAFTSRGTFRYVDGGADGELFFTVFETLVLAEGNPAGRSFATSGATTVNADLFVIDGNLELDHDLDVDGAALIIDAEPYPPAPAVGVPLVPAPAPDGNGSITTPGVQTVTFSGQLWINGNGATGFDPGAGTVILDVPADGDPNPDVYVFGDNQFNVLETQTGADPGRYVAFEAGTQQEIVSGGVLRIRGTDLGGDDTPDSAWIRLRSTDPGGVQWNLLVTPGATVDLEFVDIFDSNAINPIIIPPRVNAPGGQNNTNWLDFLIVSRSFTLDEDGDGKIDSIRVELPAIINDDFSDTEIRVSGYEVTGYDTGVTSTDEYFRIRLREKDFLDTGVTPSWYIVDGTTDLLRDDATNTRVVVVDPVVPETPTTPFDEAHPIIGYTLAVADRNEIFVQFSEPVYDTNAPTPIGIGNFPGPNFNVTALSPVTSVGAGIREALLTTAAAITAADIVTEVQLNTNTIVDGSTNPLSSSLPLLVEDFHRVSDVALGPIGDGLFEPTFAADQTVRDPERGGTGIVRDFDGGEFLQPENLRLQVRIRPDVDTAISPTAGQPELYFGSDIPSRFVRRDLWLPTFDDTLEPNFGAFTGTSPPPPYTAGDTNTSAFSGLVPLPTPSSEYDTTAPDTATGLLRGYSVASSNPEVANEVFFDFFFLVPGTVEPLYGARLAAGSDPWYRRVRPWSLELRELFAQRGNVTIANNVINPNQGDRATLNYALDSAGLVRINVFNVAGDLIDTLYTGRQEAGEHSTTWDGTNRQGYPVARGIYFIRVMSNGIDEYRKVMVVK